MDFYKVILGFLSPDEQTKLIKYIGELAWDNGRQGTGYLKAAVSDSKFQDIKKRSLEALSADVACKHDCYVIRYPLFSHIPPHVDDAPFGTEHWRMNAIIQASEQGGIFGLEERSLDLLEGDGVIFRADKMRHRVSTVNGNVERYVWSVGVLK